MTSVEKDRIKTIESAIFSMQQFGNETIAYSFLLVGCVDVCFVKVALFPIDVRIRTVTSCFGHWSSQVTGRLFYGKIQDSQHDWPF
jgi:hypothetical protein